MKMMSLPQIQECTKIPINAVKVFVPIKETLLQSYRYKNQNPELFVDVEMPNEEYKFMSGKELHLGIRASFEVEPIFKSNVKMNRIDVYIPFDLISDLINALLILKYKEANK